MLVRLASWRALLLTHWSFPDYHHSGRSLGDPAFTEWLRNLVGLGHEIVIHGFYHERARGMDESTRQKLVTRVYTADEGEFYDLDYEEAARRIRNAQKEFAEHGFHPTGFIAPAWLLGAEAQRAAADAGLSYTTTLRAVHDLLAYEKLLRNRSFIAFAVAGGEPWLAWNRSLPAPNE
jgi:predicted deacetylase